MFNTRVWEFQNLLRTYNISMFYGGGMLVSVLQVSKDAIEEGAPILSFQGNKIIHSIPYI